MNPERGDKNAIVADRKSRTVLCEEARNLLNSFGEAIQDVLLLQEQQFHAVVHGDESAYRFDLLIHDANHRKQNAKYAYMMHLHQHGCSPMTSDHDTD